MPDDCTENILPIVFSVLRKNRSRLRFHEKLGTQSFLVTVELSPPKGTDITRFIERARSLQPVVDAINVPDCQRAILKMSSLAAAKILRETAQVDVIWQISCRDRNVIALQADLLGGSALGIETVLALTGDPVQVGDHKDVAQQVFHLEAIRLLRLIQTMNAGADATGKPFQNGGTQFTAGAALNPARLRNRAQLQRLKQKLALGVRFFQTQPVYTLDLAEQTMAIIHEASHEVGCLPPKVLLGMIPPKNAAFARFINQSVSGIQIPEALIERLDNAARPAEESIRYCADIMASLKPVTDGFHLMPVAMESRALQCLALAGFGSPCKLS